MGEVLGSVAMLAAVVAGRRYVLSGRGCGWLMLTGALVTLGVLLFRTGG